MKVKPSSDYLIAAAVIVCSLILVGALTIALSNFRFGGGGRTLEIRFGSVTGIHVNSQVRYAGKTIGKVVEIGFLTAEERQNNPRNAVRVIASLDTDAPILYQGTAATILSDTILAEKFVDVLPAPIDPLGPIPLQLADHEPIQGQESISIDELTRVGFQTIDQVNRFLADLKRDYPDLHTKVGSIIDHSERLVTNADDLVKELDNLIARSDPTLSQTLKDMKVIAQNLKVTTTYSKAFTKTIGEKPWRVIFGGEVNELPTEEEILKSTKPIPVPKPTETEKKAETVSRKK